MRKKLKKIMTCIMAALLPMALMSGCTGCDEEKIESLAENEEIRSEAESVIEEAFEKAESLKESREEKRETESETEKVTESETEAAWY